MRRLDAMHARREGLDPARWRPLELAEPQRRLARRLFEVRWPSDARPFVRMGVRYLRLWWLATCCDRHDLARYMAAKAEGEMLRASHTAIGGVAGDAMLAQQRRHFAGRAAHGAAPQRIAEQVRQAAAAFPDASNRELARLTGIPETTVRRHRPRKTQRGVAP